jgi:hypothetical protein
MDDTFSLTNMSPQVIRMGAASGRREAGAVLPPSAAPVPSPELRNNLYCPHPCPVRAARLAPVSTAITGLASRGSSKI